MELIFSVIIRMASLVVGTSIVFLILLFNARKNPQTVPLPALTSAQLHGHKIAAGHNRLPEIGATCNCNNSFGFMSKPESDKYGSNNWLPCHCKMQGPVHGTKYAQGNYLNGSLVNCPDASHGSCFNYNRKMALIHNPNAKYHGEKIEHLKFITQLNREAGRNCKSVIGFTPKPRCDSCHAVRSSGVINNANRFYDF